jgi:lipopolysaccharide/colanic/teichoic acid biosynthesis glycosyltransferase
MLLLKVLMLLQNNKVQSIPKRIFDIIASIIGLLILLPFFLIIALLIIINSGFPVFYTQKRVGKGNSDFGLLKFRTMKKNSDKLGLLTVGGRDPRITAIGFYLRKYKLDELPQLINVLIGDMSLVGPRPEVRKYVDLYNDEQKKVLLVKPGITDYASLEYFSENDLLAKSTDPEATYIKEIMPAKLDLNKKYISEMGLNTDLKIIFGTLKRIIS